MGRTEFGARWLWVRSSKGGRGSGPMRRIDGGEEQGGCGRHGEKGGVQQGELRD